MNMISTGAFLNEMDASNKQSTVAEKFAAVWEKKNAKAARAGGVSLMALSLAACGGSSSTTTTTTDTSTDTTTTTPATPASKSFTLTTGIDSGSSFTGGDAADTFSATASTLSISDALDGGAGSDTLKITDTAGGLEAGLASNLTLTSIETVDISSSAGLGKVGVDAVAQVNTYAAITVTADVAGISRIAFTNDTKAGDPTLTVTYNGSTMGFATDTDVEATTATNLTAAINAAAGETVAYAGKTIGNANVSDVTGSVITVNSVAGLSVGMEASGTNMGSGSYITAIDTANNKVTVSAIGTYAATADLVLGNGAKSVTVIPNVKGSDPVISLSDTTNTTITKTVSAVDGNEGNTVSFKYGDQTGSYLVGADATTTGTNFANALNAVAGSTIATASSGAVTVTAGTAGTALPAITFTGASGDTPAVTYTTANKASVDNNTFDLSGHTAVTDVTASIVGGANVKLAGTQNLTIVNAADATDGAGEVQVAGGRVLNITTSGTGSVDVDGKDITEVTVTGGSGGVDIDNLGGTGGTTSSEGETLTKVTLTKVDGDSALKGDALLDVTVGGATTAARQITISNDQASSGHDLAFTAAGTGYKSDGTTEVQTVLVDTNAKQVDMDVTAKSSVDVTGNSAMKTLNITGEGALKVAADNSATTKIDASGNSGGVNFGAIHGNTLSVTGSSGVDKVTLDTAAKYAIDLGAGADELTIAATLTSGAVVDAGAGTDKFITDDADAYDTDLEFSAFKNFEVLVANDGATDAAEDYDMDVFSGFTGIEIGANDSTSDDITISNATAAQAANIKVTGDQAGKLIVSLKDATGSADVVSVTYGKGTTNTAAFNQGEAIDIAGVETLNLATNAGPTATDTETVIAALTGNKLTAINLTGSKFDFTNAATTKAVTIDGSALTGGLKVAGDLVVGSVVKGTAKVDTISLGQAGSKYELGAGKDSITGVLDSELTDGTNYAEIDGGADKDTLTFAADTAGITLTDASFTKITNVEKIVADNDGGAYAFSLTGGSEFSEAFSGGFELDTEVGDAAVTVSAASATVNMKVDVTAATATAARDISITTGTGDDTILLTAASATTTKVDVDTGAGDDSITLTFTGATLILTNDAMTIDAGKGKDTVTLTDVTVAEADHVTIKIEAGDSLVGSYDSYTGYIDSTGALLGMKIDFDGSAAIATAVTNQAISGFTSSEATLSSNSTGVVTFNGTSTLTLDQKIAAVQAEFVGANETVVFGHQNDAYVFHNSTSGDSLVHLISQAATAGLEASTGTTAGEIVIA